MRYTTNECYDCGLPCIYEACPCYRVQHFSCDWCKKEEKLYYYNGYEICGKCLLGEFSVVEGSEDFI